MELKQELPLESLAALCQRWGISELSVFGSALRDDFSPESDLDLVVNFAPGRTPGLEYFDLMDEIEQLTGRCVDLFTRTGIEHSRNTEFRDEVQRTAQVIYAAS